MAPPVSRRDPFRPMRADPLVGDRLERAAVGGVATGLRAGFYFDGTWPHQLEIGAGARGRNGAAWRGGKARQCARDRSPLLRNSVMAFSTASRVRSSKICSA